MLFIRILEHNQDKANVVFRMSNNKSFQATGRRRRSSIHLFKQQLNDDSTNPITQSSSKSATNEAAATNPITQSSSKSEWDLDELFHLVLHIPLPDGSIVDHDIRINKSYDPTILSTEICTKHKLNPDVMCARIENEINRLVALETLEHTQSFCEELEQTRKIALEAHEKQKQDNITLKSR